MPRIAVHSTAVLKCDIPTVETMLLSQNACTEVTLYVLNTINHHLGCVMYAGK